MTEDELSEIEARAAEASPWPWGMQMRGSDSVLISVLSRKIVAVVPSDGSDDIFLLMARQDIPALCAEVRRLRARVAELEAQ